MISDPWSRPTLDELHEILDGIEKHDSDLREVERLDLAIPAEVVTRRGNTISAMTREISRQGLGLLHRGSLSPGEVTVRMASESRAFTYRVVIDWCYPCQNGMFMSGGHFIGKVENSSG